MFSIRLSTVTIITLLIAGCASEPSFRQVSVKANMDPRVAIVLSTQEIFELCELRLMRYCERAGYREISYDANRRQQHFTAILSAAFEGDAEVDVFTLEEFYPPGVAPDPHAFFWRSISYSISELASSLNYDYVITIEERRVEPIFLPRATFHEAFVGVDTSLMVSLVDVHQNRSIAYDRFRGGISVTKSYVYPGTSEVNIDRVLRTTDEVFGEALMCADAQSAKTISSSAAHSLTIPVNLNRLDELAKEQCIRAKRLIDEL